MRCVLPLALAALLTPGCRTAPQAPLPGPLPRATPWHVAEDGRAFLGVRGEENSGGSLEALSFDPGVRVLRVVQNSPAARAGITPGDVILAAGERTLDDPAALDVVVQRAGPGAALILSVLRGDTVFEVPLTLTGAGAGATPPPRELYVLDPVRSRAGWRTTSDGVLLAESDPEGPFVRAGLPLGSAVLRLDGKELLSARGLVRALQDREPGSQVQLRARLPDGSLRDLEVTLYDVPLVITELGLPILFAYRATPDRQRVDTSVLDLWFFQLFQYHRDGGERRWVLFELFGFDLFEFASGLGELSE